MHGNEPAGARAAEQIRHWPIVKGRLVVVPRANVPGLAANTRFLPDVAKDQRDLNRNFPADDKGDTRSVIAAAIWELAGKEKPDWVLDLHEGYAFNRSHQPAEGRKKSVGSSLIYFKGDAMDAIARKMQSAVNATIDNADRKFTLLDRGPINTGLARATIRHFGARAMILETTFKDQPMSLRTRQHRTLVNVVMRHIGMIDHDCVDVLASTDDDTTVVGIYDAAGTGGSGVRRVADILEKTGRATVHHLGPTDMRDDVLARFDAVVFPGGSGSKQARAIGTEGRQAVQRFVKAGGGYIGICAGAYLCSAHYDWSLHLVDTACFNKTVDIPGVGKKSMWYRGSATTLPMELTEQGKAIFGDVPMRVQVRYHNGPIVSPKGKPNLPTYLPLAHFRGEQVRYEPQRGTLVDTPAIVASRFGKGRVIAISPHPESTPTLHPIITGALRWVTKQEAQGVERERATVGRSRE